MLGGGRLLQGLAFGIVGCAIVPLTKSSFFTGGGAEQVSETTSFHSTQSDLPQQLTPTVKKEEFPKLLKTISLLLAGENSKDGIVAQLSLYQEENENKKWNVDKVTWRGIQWQDKWTLFYDDKTREYIFSDKEWIEKGDNTCWGQARKWDNYKVCLSRGVVLPEHENIYRTKFPKIKLNGWRVTWPRYWGYSVREMPNHLDYCKNVSVKEGNNNDLEVTIGCKSSTLQKIFKNTEINDDSLGK